MSDNTITASNGVEIYADDMYIYADEYINALHDKDIIYSQKGNAFTGLIKYINKHMCFSQDMYADINVLNDIWDNYTDLCYKYNQNPTIEEYALLIGCSRSTLYSWRDGEMRSADICDKLGSSRSDTIKKWSEECKVGRYKSAAAGNVGGIFLCKAVDGMVETAPAQVPYSGEQRKSNEQILQEHGIKAIDTAVTELPDADF